MSHFSQAMFLQLRSRWYVLGISLWRCQVMYYLSVFLFNEEGNFDSYLHLGSCNMKTGVMLFHTAVSSTQSS